MSIGTPSIQTIDDAPQGLAGASTRRSSATYGIIRVVLAVVLIAAGVLKAIASTSRGAAASGSGSRLLLAGVVGFEVLLGVVLFVGFRPRAARRVAQCCLALFCTISLAKVLEGEASCGCFGDVRISPLAVFAFDAVALAALLRWGPPEGAPSGGVSRRSVVAALLGLAVVPVIVLVIGPRVPADSGKPFAGLEPGAWTGGQFPLLPFIDVGEQLSDGRWIVVLYHHDCRSCLREIPKYKALARSTSSEAGRSRLALIEMPPYADVAGQRPDPDGVCLVGRLDDSKAWSVATPVDVRLEDGVVRSAITDARLGEATSP